MPETSTNSAASGAVLFRIAVCLVILALGVVAMYLLESAKRPPANAPPHERAVRVEVSPAKFEDVVVALTSWGEVRPRDTVVISPVISGRIVYVHPRLEAGEIIPEGETLFRVDPRDYQAALDDAKATAKQWAATVSRLKTQYELDTGRLKTLNRNVELAQSELARLTKLKSQSRVITEAEVEASERTANLAVDAADQLAHMVELYPFQIAEAEATLKSIESKVYLAETNLERTTVATPFDARIKSADLELDQFVSPGTAVVTLADDSILEIAVPLDSREARDWLRFDSPEDYGPSQSQSWFSHLTPVDVEVIWTEDNRTGHHNGRLERVEKFDPATRTLTLVARLDGKEVLATEPDGLPLVEGMFCMVKIPGKVAHDVVRVPAAAVSFPRDGTGERVLYVARKNDQGEFHLATRRVKESHKDGEFSFIQTGIQEGDYVITTMLVNPLENTLLEVSLPEE